MLLHEHSVVSHQCVSHCGLVVSHIGDTILRPTLCMSTMAWDAANVMTTICYWNLCVCSLEGVVFSSGWGRAVPAVHVKMCAHQSSLMLIDVAPPTPLHQLATVFICGVYCAWCM